MPSDHSFGFEVTAHLLLFGELPNKEQLDGFIKTAVLPHITHKFRARHHHESAERRHDEHPRPQRADDVSYDDDPDDISIPNVLRQCIQLIAIFSASFRLRLSGVSPLSRRQKSLHSPAEAELFHRRKYSCVFCVPINSSPLEAKVLDIALMLHAEHGGGNNSTFTTHVVVLRHGYLLRHCRGTRL